jgi:hypothetical protein
LHGRLRCLNIGWVSLLMRRASLARVGFERFVGCGLAGLLRARKHGFEYDERQIKQQHGNLRCHNNARFSRAVTPKTAPVRAEAEAEVSREETPHISVTLLWALNPPMPIKFGVKRPSSTATLIRPLIGCQRLSGVRRFVLHPNLAQHWPYAKTHGSEQVSWPHSVDGRGAS